MMVRIQYTTGRAFTRSPAASRAARTARSMPLALALTILTTSLLEVSTCEAWEAICVSNCNIDTRPTYRGPSENESRQHQAHVLNERALELWNNGDGSLEKWNQTIFLIEQALSLWPYEPVYAENLRNARQNRQNAIERAEQHRRQDAYSSALNEGNRARSERRWQDAVLHYEQALVYRPNDPSALENLRYAQKNIAAPQVAASARRLLQDVLEDPLGLPPTNGMRWFADIDEVKRSIANIKHIVHETPAEAQRMRIEAALEILAAPWAIGYSRRLGEVQREVVLQRAKAELRSLLRSVLEDACERMLQDLQHAREKQGWFNWNRFDTERGEVIGEMERDLIEARIQARGHMETGDMFQRADPTMVEFRPALALRQLDQIHWRTIWESQ